MKMTSALESHAFLPFIAKFLFVNITFSSMLINNNSRIRLDLQISAQCNEKKMFTLKRVQPRSPHKKQHHQLHKRYRRRPSVGYRRDSPVRASCTSQPCRWRSQGPHLAKSSVLWWWQAESVRKFSIITIWLLCFENWKFYLHKAMKRQ